MYRPVRGHQHIFRIGIQKFFSYRFKLRLGWVFKTMNNKRTDGNVILVIMIEIIEYYLVIVSSSLISPSGL